MLLAVAFIIFTNQCTTYSLCTRWLRRSCVMSSCQLFLMPALAAGLATGIDPTLPTALSFIKLLKGKLWKQMRTTLCLHMNLLKLTDNCCSGLVLPWDFKTLWTQRIEWPEVCLPLWVHVQMQNCILEKVRLLILRLTTNSPIYSNGICSCNKKVLEKRHHYKSIRNSGVG